MPPPSIFKNGKYRLGRSLGSGSFGAVHEGVHTRKGTKLAIKVEHELSLWPQLKHEAKVYRALTGDGAVGFPLIHWFGQEARLRILVMELLGPSLEWVFAQLGG